MKRYFLVIIHSSISESWPGPKSRWHMVYVIWPEAPLTWQVSCYKIALCFPSLYLATSSELSLWPHAALTIAYPCLSSWLKCSEAESTLAVLASCFTQTCLNAAARSLASSLPPPPPHPHEYVTQDPSLQPSQIWLGCLPCSFDAFCQPVFLDIPTSWITGILAPCVSLSPFPVSLKQFLLLLFP